MSYQAATDSRSPCTAVSGRSTIEECESPTIRDEAHSSIVDLPLTAVQGDLLSVAAWYDNEMGYATRLAETATVIAEQAASVAVGSVA